jgi:hypothetical protein
MKKSKLNKKQMKSKINNGKLILKITEKAKIIILIIKTRREKKHTFIFLFPKQTFTQKQGLKLYEKGQNII